jgi:dienelactone hydrolase
MAWEDALSAYEKFELRGRSLGPARSGGAGQGPAVIMIHEIPGLHSLVIRFADRVARGGR